MFAITKKILKWWMFFSFVFFVFSVHILINFEGSNSQKTGQRKMNKASLDIMIWLSKDRTASEVHSLVLSVFFSFSLWKLDNKKVWQKEYWCLWTLVLAKPGREDKWIPYICCQVTSLRPPANILRNHRVRQLAATGRLGSGSVSRYLEPCWLKCIPRLLRLGVWEDSWSVHDNWGLGFKEAGSF